MRSGAIRTGDSMGFWNWLFGRKPAPVIPIKTPPTYPPNFLAALEYTLQNEGGYSNNPNDYGKATNWGITKHDLSRWRGYQVSDSEVKAMGRHEAEAIYFKFYWQALSLDRVLDKKLAMALFDRGVLGGLTGVSRHVRAIFGFEEHAFDDAPNFLQQMELLNQAIPVAFIMVLADRCEAAHRARVQKDPSQKTFLFGWLRRVGRMRKELGDGSERVIEQWIKDASGR